MDHKTLLHHLAVVVVVAAGLGVGGCERRPRDPKPPSDPGRNVPKPIIAAALPVLPVLTALSAPACAAG